MKRLEGPAVQHRQIVNDFLKEIGEPLPRPLVNGAIARIEERLVEVRCDAGEFGLLQQALRQSHEVSGRRWPAWVTGALAAGLAVAALMLPPPLNSSVVAKADSGEIYIAPLQKLISKGYAIEAGQAVRSGADGGAVELQDRSRIEMSADSELSVVHAEDGMRVRLASGTVIVTAARQRQGHLYVETRDLLISVVGTVFSVSAESTGSRVSVIEGEVHVRRGQTEQTLLPGQQASTSLALGPIAVESEIGWSKSAGKLVALLQQAPPLVPAPPRLDGTNVVTGVVKRASTAEPISGLAVSLCPLESGKAAALLTAVQTNPGLNGEVRMIVAPVDKPLPVLVTPDGAGPIIKNKTFFFSLFDSACRNPMTSTTDSAGRFRFADQASGEYTIRVEGEGYFGSPANGEYPASVSQRITISAQQTLPELSFSMIRGGTITGRVRDAEGKLASNVTISAGKSNSGGGFRTFVSKATDDRGEYRLFWLPPGEYYVGAGMMGTGSTGIFRYFNNWTESSIAAAGLIFYPNASSVADAQTIVVKEGDEVPGVDMLIRR
jgi:hypothetical protein